MSARFVCLFLLPVVLYLGQFFIMLSVLQKTGLHDNLMSSSFQKTLEVKYYLILCICSVLFTQVVFLLPNQGCLIYNTL